MIHVKKGVLLVFLPLEVLLCIKYSTCEAFQGVKATSYMGISNQQQANWMHR